MAVLDGRSQLDWSYVMTNFCSILWCHVQIPKFLYLYSQCLWYICSVAFMIMNPWNCYSSRLFSIVCLELTPVCIASVSALSVALRLAWCNDWYFGPIDILFWRSLCYFWHIRSQVVGLKYRGLVRWSSRFCFHTLMCWFEELKRQRHRISYQVEQCLIFWTFGWSRLCLMMRRTTAAERWVPDTCRLWFGWCLPELAQTGRSRSGPCVPLGLRSVALPEPSCPWSPCFAWDFASGQICLCSRGRQFRWLGVWSRGRISPSAARALLSHNTDISNMKTILAPQMQAWCWIGWSFELPDATAQWPLSYRTPCRSPSAHSISSSSSCSQSGPVAPSKSSSEPQVPPSSPWTASCSAYHLSWPEATGPGGNLLS